MRIDPAELSARDRYGWLIASVIPRPIALVSTRSADGVDNLAPFSFYNGVCSSPPVLSLAIGRRRDGRAKDTLANIVATGELVVNLTGEAIAQPAVDCAVDHPPELSELAACGFTAVPSERVAPPRLAESPLAMECRLLQTLEVGETPTTLVLAEVLLWHVDDAVLTDGLPDPAKLRPLGRLGGRAYRRGGEILSLTPRAPD